MKEKKKSDTSRYVGNSSEDIVMLGESKNDGFIKEEEKNWEKGLSEATRTGFRMEVKTM